MSLVLSAVSLSEEEVAVVDEDRGKDEEEEDVGEERGEVGDDAEPTVVSEGVDDDKDESEPAEPTPLRIGMPIIAKSISVIIGIP